MDKLGQILKENIKDKADQFIRSLNNKRDNEFSRNGSIWNKTINYFNDQKDFITNEILSGGIPRDIKIPEYFKILDYLKNNQSLYIINGKSLSHDNHPLSDLITDFMMWGIDQDIRIIIEPKNINNEYSKTEYVININYIR